MQYTVYLALAPIAGILSITSVVLAWQSRKVTGFQTLLWLLLSITGLLFSNLLEFLSPTEAGTFFWARFSYLFVSFLPLLWLAFSLEYTGHPFWLNRSRFWVFCLLPLATLVFVFNRPFLWMIWKEYQYQPAGDFHVLHVLQYGPWFYIFVVYNYLLVLGGAGLIVLTYFRSASIFRQQSRWMVVGALLPLLANVVYSFRLIPGLTKDFSPIAYTFAGLCFTVDVYQHMLLDLMPVARGALFDRMRDGVAVVDGRLRIVDANQSAVVLLGMDRSLLIGASAAGLNPFWNVTTLPGAGQEIVQEVVHKHDGRRRFYEVRTLCLANKAGRINGYLVTIHENTRDQELLAQVEHLAQIDPLTEVYNRRSLFELAELELQQAGQTARPLSVVMADLDKFKEVNDGSGHLAGDQVLVQIANQLKVHLRSRDQVARFGGDEFIILLADTPAEEAYCVAERLRGEIERLNLPCSCTVSMGVATMQSGTGKISLDELVEHADRALYNSKVRGGNLVTAYSPDSPARQAGAA